MALPPYDPNFTIGLAPTVLKIADDLEHDPSASAAIVAANLISSARLAYELDSEYTEYSAQFLVDEVGMGVKLTVKDCLKFALSNGIPKARNWTHFGSVLKPPSSFKPALISMKGDVVETKDMEEVRELLKHQPIGAKLHVFSPQIDLVGDGIYCGSSGEPTGYVGLRDVIIVRIEKIMGKSIAIVKMWYKRRFTYVKVALSRMFLHTSTNPDGSEFSEGTCYLIDFVAPRLSMDQETLS